MPRPALLPAALLIALTANTAHAEDFSSFDGRADFVEEVLAGPDVSGSWGTYTLARLAYDPDDAVALEQAVEVVVMLDNQSVPIGTIALGLYWDHFSPEQRQTMLEAMKSWNEIDGHGTENHALMQNVSGYLFTQWFPDELDWTTNSMGPMDSAPLNARIRDNLVTVASSLYDKGYAENLSTTYLLLHVYPWMMLQQFSNDEELRNIANAAIHFHLANLAVNSFHGQVVSPFNRANFQQQNTPHVFDAEGEHNMIPQVPFLSWLYWGEDTHFNDVETLGEAMRRFHGHVGFFASMRAWGPPAPVLHRIGAGEGVPYTVRSSAPDFGAWGSGDPRDNMRTIYRTERYAVGTGFFRYAPESFYINYNNFGVLYETQDKFNVIDINQNYWMSDLEEAERWEKCMNSIFQQDAQHENTVISLFNIPASDPWVGLGRADWIANRDEHYDSVIQRADVRYPKSVDEVVEHEGWVFLRESDVYVAIRPMRGYTLDSDTLPDFNVLRSDGATNVIITEVGTADEHGEFSAFREKVEANPLTVDWETLNVAYTDSQGDAIEAQWVAPSYTPPKGEERVLVRPEMWVNGEPEPDLAAEEWPLLASPLVNLEGRILRLEHGLERLTIDWSGELPVFLSETLCEDGLTDCGEVSELCVDLSTDAAHCGACGEVCEAPEHADPVCAASGCIYTCEDGWSDCNELAEDGCEHEGACPSTDTDTDTDADADPDPSMPTDPSIPSDTDSPDANGMDSDNAGGCACQADGGPRDSGWPLALGLALFGVGASSRSRRRPTSAPSNTAFSAKLPWIRTR